MTIQQAKNNLNVLTNLISKRFRNVPVSNVVIHEDGDISATVNGKTYVDCGFVEDYDLF